MATRKQAREAVVQLLYARELGNDNVLAQAPFMFDMQKIRNKQQEFALSLLHGVCLHEEKIIQIMNVFLKTWNIDRLGVVERGILKLGIYEILYTDTQKAVIINEAIELTKSFGLHDAFRLVNGVLDSVARMTMQEIELEIQKYEATQQYKDNTAEGHAQIKAESNTLEQEHVESQGGFFEVSIKGQSGEAHKTQLQSCAQDSKHKKHHTKEKFLKNKTAPHKKRDNEHVRAQKKHMQAKSVRTKDSGDIQRRNKEFASQKGKNKTAIQLPKGRTFTIDKKVFDDLQSPHISASDKDV